MGVILDGTGLTENDFVLTRNGPDKLTYVLNQDRNPIYEEHSDKIANVIRGLYTHGFFKYADF